MSTNRILLALALSTAAVPALADHYDYSPAPAARIVLAQATQSSLPETRTDCPADMPASGNGNGSSQTQFEYFLNDFTRLGG